MGQQFLHLVQHVIILLLALVLSYGRLHSVIHAQHVVTEGRNHKELLHHRVHVANATQIAQAYVLLHSAGITCRLIVPN